MRISDDSIKQIARHLAVNPVADNEKINSVIKENVAGGEVHMPFVFGDTRTRLRLTVPPHVRNTAYHGVRQSLPIYEYREMILDVIRNHQVCVISGETGTRVAFFNFQTILFSFIFFILFCIIRFIRLKQAVVKRHKFLNTY